VTGSLRQHGSGWRIVVSPIIPLVFSDLAQNSDSVRRCNISVALWSGYLINSPHSPPPMTFFE
jgi:hypothetical protein